MKQITLFIALIFLFTGCQQNDEQQVYQETGTVLDYAGADHCSFVIELDNGQKILPLYYPDDFEFVNGQKLLVSYSELPNVISTCGKGIVSEIVQIEEIACGSPVMVYEPEVIHSLPNDPVYLHNLTLEGDCLKLKVSFSGGCRNHIFELVKLDEEEEEEGIAVLGLRHDAKGDICEAALTMDLSFDVSSLKEQGYTHFYFQAQLPYDETYIDLLELK